MFVPSGVNSAMLTPLTIDYKINEPVVRQWIDFMINHGINGLFPVSSIGDFVNLDISDSYRMMTIVVEQVAGRIPIFPGASAASTDISIRLARYAEKIGCQAVVVMPPYYCTISQDLIFKHFQKVANAISIGVIIYNNPWVTTPITLDTFKKLIKIENIIAIKDSSGDMKSMMHLMNIVREEDRSDFAIMTGWDDMLYPSLCIGAKGCITGTCGILPEIIVEIYKKFQEGNKDKALEIQNSILPILRTMSSIQFPAGYKLALDIRGFYTGPSHLPVNEIDEDKYYEVKKSLETQLSNLLGEKVLASK